MQSNLTRIGGGRIANTDENTNIMNHNVNKKPTMKFNPPLVQKRPMAAAKSGAVPKLTQAKQVPYSPQV
jgi:hypothetical protein